MATRRSLMAASLFAAMAGACTSTRSPEPAAVTIDAPAYTSAFDASRAVLRDHGFILERVDSAAGVITTRPKTTAGLATPWDREQQSAEQELQDLFQRQQRIIRVTFTPSRLDKAPPGLADADAPSPPDPASPVRIEVLATIQRVQIPGAKLEPEAIRQSSYFLDTDLAARGMHPSYAVAVARDDALEARLAELIRRRLMAPSVPAATETGAPASEPESVWTPARPLEPSPAPPAQ